MTHTHLEVCSVDAQRRQRIRGGVAGCLQCCRLREREGKREEQMFACVRERGGGGHLGSQPGNTPPCLNLRREIGLSHEPSTHLQLWREVCAHPQAVEWHRLVRRQGAHLPEQLRSRACGGGM